MFTTGMHDRGKNHHEINVRMAMERGNTLSLTTNGMDERSPRSSPLKAFEHQGMTTSRCTRERPL